MLNWIYGLAAKLRQKLSEKGQGMVEYALILAAVAIIAVVAFLGTDGAGGDGTLAGTIRGAFTKASTSVTTATGSVDNIKTASGSTQASQSQSQNPNP